ncbi:folylpolyglutamate synthase, mitochondrial, partial [Silurus asotus]
EDAICTLNTLQTNASALEQVRRERAHPQIQLQAMKSFLQRSGLTVEELDHLNIIHVTGTKGKGSTCAFTEKILRSYGFRTGFYSSPHLVQVRERIRLNGSPIGKDLFTKYFWQIYSRLNETKACLCDVHGGSMPAYFRFLTILAFHVFLQEKVDVAIIEVGIGGAYDCTNIIRRPWVCGISSLGIDHTSILGDTIEKIAWQKGGIFKPGVPAFIVKQPEGPMAVLQERAEEIGCCNTVVPNPWAADRHRFVSQLVPGHTERIHNLHYFHFISDSKQCFILENYWISSATSVTSLDASVTSGPGFSGLQTASVFEPSPLMLKGLAETEWLGRTQTLTHGSVTYFLDGAHTTRSMQACVNWFSEAATQHEKDVMGSVVRVLLFNATGERDCGAMLKLLVECHFDFAVFCPNITEAIADCNADQQNFNVSVEHMLTRCLDNQQSWRVLNGIEEEVPKSELLIGGGVHLPRRVERRSASLVFPCILSALQWITQGHDPLVSDSAKHIMPVKASINAKAAPLREAANVHVLITGSLHLVGGALKHL